MAHPDRIMKVLEEACELPPENRAEYLDQACGTDTAMRTEVESLLSSHEGAGRFLSGATVDIKSESAYSTLPQAVKNSVTAASGHEEHYGQMIGRYKLLQVIGEGGFGTVWMAEQREPVKRRVALKIIKLGMDTKQVIARFEAERQALAVMEHPCIAKVLDAGSTDTGRPYFVMEYIRGVPILEYCRTEKLDTVARLVLFAQICQAIQHAHQKGIIHRDIKPGNVLVTMHDGVPVPKVIDFGIAKATSSELTSRTLFTEHRQLIGTPAYMSPEQAEMSGLDIDTRSDIYSLGVLLYELLTGTTPFGSEELMSEGFAEMMRIIREVEPPKPSTRLSTLGHASAQQTRNREQTDSRKLATMFEGDLDWIVMKCLEKDRTRRYESASSLAADIRRYLSDEPVSAGPPGAAYRLRKLYKRNRGLVLAAGAIAAVLVMGIAGTTIGLVHAINQRARADEAAAAAVEASQAESAARQRAQQNEMLARAEAERAEAARSREARARARAETISSFVTTALRFGDAQNRGELSDAGEKMTILAAMDMALADIRAGRFKDDPDTEAELLDTISQIFRNNGRTAAAEALVVRCLELRRGLYPGDHPDLAVALEHVALVRDELGRTEEALPLLLEVVEMRRRLHTPGDSSLAGALQSLGMLRHRLGQLREADALCLEALERSREVHPGDHAEVAICLNNLALVRRSAGDYKGAEAFFSQALAMHRRLYTGDHPEIASGLNNLAMVRSDMRRIDDAEELLREALAMRERLYRGDNPSVALSLANLAALLTASDRPEDAEPLASRALEMNRRLFRGDHPALVQSLLSLGGVREKLSQPQAAEALLVEAVEMSRRLFPDGSLDLAYVLNNLATLRRNLERVEEAEPLMAEALAVRERLLDGDHPLLVDTMRNLASLRQMLGRSTEADNLLKRADEMAGRMTKPGDPASKDGRGIRAVQHWQRGELDKSIPLFEALLKDQMKTLGDNHPQTRVTAANLGVNYKDAGRFAEAIALLEAARTAAPSQKELRFALPHLLEAYAKSPDSVATGTAGRFDSLADEVVGFIRDDCPPQSAQLTGLLSQTATSLVMLKAWDKAEPLVRETLAVRERMQPDLWSTFNSRSMLGGILLIRGRLAEAEPLLIDGYAGLKQRQASIPPQGRQRLLEALDRLISLADIKGDAAAAERWRTERAALADAERKK